MAKEGSIRLHPEFGLNPTIPVCWWCGEDTGEIALLGAAYKQEAPMRMVMNRQPCKKCVERRALGITVIEVGRDTNPTGRWCVLKEDSIDRIFTSEVAGEIIKQRGVRLSVEQCDLMGFFEEVTSEPEPES